MRMFDMSTDSDLFRTAAQLETDGGQRYGITWIDINGETWVPLYEAKMIHQFDHRWATYEENGTDSRDVAEAEKKISTWEPLPRYWVMRSETDERLRAKGWTQGWLMGWRDVTSAHVLRTVISAVLPRAGCGDTLLLMLPSITDIPLLALLIANLNSLPGDYVARQKVGGTHLKYVTFKQLAIIPPYAYNKADRLFITKRVLELAYTTEAMRPFAEDLGYEGPPFTWDPDRRALLRAELDAYYAYLYGLTHDELRYILNPADVMGRHYPSETFRVLKDKELAQFGEYRTQRLVLEAWNRLDYQTR